MPPFVPDEVWAASRGHSLDHLCGRLQTEVKRGQTAAHLPRYGLLLEGARGGPNGPNGQPDVARLPDLTDGVTGAKQLFKIGGVLRGVHLSR